MGSCGYVWHTRKRDKDMTITKWHVCILGYPHDGTDHLCSCGSSGDGTDDIEE